MPAYTHPTQGDMNNAFLTGIYEVDTDSKDFQLEHYFHEPQTGDVRSMGDNMNDPQGYENVFYNC